MLLAAGGSVALIASNGQPESILPATFEVPLPAPGDAGRYAFSPDEDGTRTVMLFSLSGPATQRDASGHAHAVLAVRLDVARVEASGHVHEMPRAFFVDPDGLVVASGEETLLSPPDREAWPGWISMRTRFYDARDPTDASNPASALPCGMFNTLQGRPQAMAGDLHLLPRRCSMLDQHAGGPSTAMRATAVGVTGNVTTIHFQDPNGDQGLGLDFARNVPYPMRITLGNRSADLVGFQRGTPVAMPPSNAPPVDVDVWREAPRQVHGPDEAGVAIPFRLSQAYASARDDPDQSTLRDFAAAHEDAAVYRAFGAQQLRGDAYDQSSRYNWTFSLKGGDQRLDVCVSRWTEWSATLGIPLPAGAHTSPADVARRGRDDVRFGSPCRDASNVPPGPLPSSLGTSMPEVAPLMALWAAFAGHAGSQEPNAWRFEHTCNDMACADAPMTFMVGLSLDEFTQATAPVVGLADARVPSRSWLEVGPEGPVALVEWVPISPSAGELPDTTHLPPQLAAGSRIPDLLAVAAGTSILAALAALAYLFWPAAKTGGLALFSRIPAPRVLEHPGRALVSALVHEEPGIHAREIARRAGLPRGTASYHLSVLARAGVLASPQGRHFSCYFPRGQGGAAAVAVVGAIKSTGAQRLLAAVCGQPGLRVAEAARLAGMTRQTASQHASALERVGLLDVARDRGRVRLRLTAAGSHYAGDAGQGASA